MLKRYLARVMAIRPDKYATRKPVMSLKILGGLGLIFIVLLAVALGLRAVTRTETEMNSMMLTCELEVIPAGAGEVALAFNIRNPANQPVNIQYFQPFIDFDLTAHAEDGQVPLIQPAYDIGVQPVKVTIPAGETVRIETPIRLQFDPNIGPSGGDVPTRWTLQHEPVPVRLRATIRLSGVEVAPCEVHLNPSVFAQ